MLTANVDVSFQRVVVELPVIEPAALPGLLASEQAFVPSRSDSFPLITCGFVLGF
jgi:hypothetical protein